MPACDATTPLTDEQRRFWRRRVDDCKAGGHASTTVTVEALDSLLDELAAVKRERDVYRAFVKADGASWMEAQKLIASPPAAQGGAGDLTDEDREDVRDALATLNAPDFSTKPLEDVKRELDLANGARGGCPHCGCPSPCACPKAWEDRQGADGAGEEVDDRHP